MVGQEGVNFWGGKVVEFDEHDDEVGRSLG
jgi:hypothetical protein